MMLSSSRPTTPALAPFCETKIRWSKCILTAPIPPPDLILVKGAEPGDGICVEILAIESADQGFLWVKKGMGLLGHMATKFATKIVNIRKGQVHFDERIRFPVNPLVGVISTTPAGEGIEMGMLSPAGGNMDNRYITTGNRVYLPVQVVDGALFGLGDVHGAMGDGEMHLHPTGHLRGSNRAHSSDEGRLFFWAIAQPRTGNLRTLDQRRGSRRCQ